MPTEHRPTDETRKLVRKLSGFGLPQEQICLLINGGITKPTLHKHYREDLDRGIAEANGKVIGALFKNAVDHENVGAQIFWAKARLGWIDSGPAPVSINVTKIELVAADVSQVPEVKLIEAGNEDD